MSLTASLTKRVHQFQRRVLLTANPKTPREKGAHTRACNCLCAARRQLTALERDIPLVHWTSVTLDFDPCTPANFLRGNG